MYLRPRAQADALGIFEQELKITGTIAVTLRDRDDGNQVNVPVFRIVNK